jgi:O-Antigen ligase
MRTDTTNYPAYPFFFKEKLVVVLLAFVIPPLILASIYLDIPSYVYTVNDSLLPKYWYIGFAIICVPWIYVSLDGKGIFDYSPFTRWVAAFIFLTAAHLFVALLNDEFDRAKHVITNLQFVMLAALLGIAFSAIPKAHYSIYFPLLNIAIACLVIYDFLNPGALYSYDLPTAVPGRGAGPFVNPNRAGEALIITALLSACLLRGWHLLSLLLLCGTAVMLTFSRGGMMAWFLLFSFAVYTRKVPRYSLGVVAILIPAILAVVSGYVLSSGALADNYTANIFARLDFFGDFSLSDDSARERADVLRGGIETFTKYPFFGAGAGHTFFWEYIASTHNEAVKLCAEYGVFGLAFWIWLAVILARGNYLGDKSAQLCFVPLFMFFSMFSHNLLDSMHTLLTFALVSQKVPTLKKPVGAQKIVKEGTDPAS